MAGGATNFLICVWATQMLKRFCTKLSQEKDKKELKITLVLTLYPWIGNLVFTTFLSSFLNRALTVSRSASSPAL